jgi:hypothetical protein
LQGVRDRRAYYVCHGWIAAAPPNNRLQRTALRGAAEPGCSAAFDSVQLARLTFGFYDARPRAECTMEAALSFTAKMNLIDWYLTLAFHVPVFTAA